MLKRIAQVIVRKNNLDKFNHALKFMDCDGELVNEEVQKFEQERPKTTFVVKQAEKYLKNQERENEI
jgi:hypothetical protein